MPSSESTTNNGATDEARRRPLRIIDHDVGWALAFATIGSALRGRVAQAVLRIDHIGSTVVPGLAAKHVIDIQVTVAHVAVAGDWTHEVLPDLIRRPAVTADHLPLDVPSDADEWAKLYWSNASSVHLHVREEGRLNQQRYSLLFRDYLRADPVAAGAYGLLRRALVEVSLDDSDMYYAVKDPACDVLAGAEHWAIRTGWRPGPSDA